MKAVLLSVQPKWCGKIAVGEKTLEIRKSKPKLDVPFKVYIYCTKGRRLHFWKSKTYAYADDRRHNAFDLCGDRKIIGEFVCDRVYQYTTAANIEGVDITEDEVVSQSCLSRKELDAYEHSAEPRESCIYLIGLYCWHISNLKIYAKPRELTELRRPCLNDLHCESCGMYQAYSETCGNVALSVSRVLQSWCYVERRPMG